MISRLFLRFAAGAGLALALAIPSFAAGFSLIPGQQVIGGFDRYTTQQGDLFADLARRFDIAFPELIAANRGVDPWKPGLGREIIVPAAFVLPDVPQRGIVINLGQWRLFYFPPGGGQVVSYPLGLGVIGKKTPLGVTRVARKEPHPAWYPTASIRREEPDLPAVVPPGPDNPLGDYALHLGWPSYLIHGTNKPDGVGRNVSHGCIRLYPEDIAQLFSLVSVGTPVRVVNQPATAGWYGDTLYVAVYPTKKQVYQLDVGHPVDLDPAPGVEKIVRAAARGANAEIDWAAVTQAAEQRTGMPVPVGVRRALAETAAAPASVDPNADQTRSWPPAITDPESAAPDAAPQSTDSSTATPIEDSRER